MSESQLIAGTRASWITGLELLLGLLLTGTLLAGVRLAWRGQRAAHVRTMRLTLGLMGLFLLLFLGNALTRGGVEALEGEASPAFLGLLLVHVSLSLGGGLLLLRVIRWGWLADRNGSQSALIHHRRWGGFVAGFWLVNGLLGALVFWIAYIL
jgi:uncharacterized membrane protein YozB (DUF420 family)